MITKESIAIIPVRSGSKGIVNKNIFPLNGVPMVAYTIKAAIQSGMFDTVMISTDSEEYADIARKYGAEVPFLRSAEASSDKASSWEAITEVLDEYEKIGVKYNKFALLQATSPLRTAEDIVNAFHKMEELNANAVVSVCDSGIPMCICNELPDNHSLTGFLRQGLVTRRQGRSLLYYLNGAIYLVRTEAYRKQKTIYDSECYAYVMDKIHSFDVDEEEDIFICESLIKNMKGVIL